MELRHLRYFVAIGEEENYRRAAQRLHIAQTALSTQIQDLEAELGFKLFDRLPRGVRLSTGGKLFLQDARRILQQVNEAAARAARVARGQSGTLRIGFTENASWHGVVPESLRIFRERHPDAELQLHPASSMDQLEEIRSGRVDAGFLFNVPEEDRELENLAVALQYVELAAPQGHPVAKIKKLRLRDLVDIPFVWFPRREAPGLYDRMMHECYRGGLKSPRIVQEAANEATILSLVSHGLGVGWVNTSARWRCPARVVILKVVDLKMPLPMALAWKRGNTSPLLANFIADVRHLPGVRAAHKARKPRPSGANPALFAPGTDGYNLELISFRRHENPPVREGACAYISGEMLAQDRRRPESRTRRNLFD